MTDKIFDAVIEAFANCNEVEVIALGGSRISKHFDEKSDYDVYIYGSSVVPQDKRQTILMPYCEENTLDMGNQFWELGDEGILKNGIGIDMMYRNLSDFERELENVVFNHQAYNGYTTCLWHNLLNSKILVDKKEHYKKLQEKFDIPYPEQLKANIIERNRFLLSGKLFSYDKQITKAINRNDFVSVNHRVAAFLASYFDIIFALNAKTHPGEKRLIEICKKECAILPNHFEENIITLLENLYSCPEKSLRALNAILEELDKKIV